MKKILFLSFALVLFTAASHAQSTDTTASGKNHKEWHNKKKDNAEFFKKLNLSDDQISKLKTIKQDQKTKIDAIKNNSTLNADDKKSQIKAAKTDAYNKRQEVYTPEQKAIIKEDHQKHPGKGQSKD